MNKSDGNGSPEFYSVGVRWYAFHDITIAESKHENITWFAGSKQKHNVKNNGVKFEQALTLFLGFSTNSTYEVTRFLISFDQAEYHASQVLLSY